MIVKIGDAKILNVIEDDEHQLDDEGTRKAMQAAAKKKEAEDSKPPKVN